MGNPPTWSNQPLCPQPPHIQFHQSCIALVIRFIKSVQRLVTLRPSGGKSVGSAGEGGEAPESRPRTARDPAENQSRHGLDPAGTREETGQDPVEIRQRPG